MSVGRERTPTAADVEHVVYGQPTPPTPPSFTDRLGTACVGFMLLLVLLSTFAAVLFLTGYGALWAFLGILDLLDGAR